MADTLSTLSTLWGETLADLPQDDLDAAEEELEHLLLDDRYLESENQSVELQRKMLQGAVDRLLNFSTESRRQVQAIMLRVINGAAANALELRQRMVARHAALERIAAAAQ